MKIQELTFEAGRDFHAVMECEHCGVTQQNDSGYHDSNYHEQVIPGMFCKSCGKNRDGKELINLCPPEDLNRELNETNFDIERCQSAIQLGVRTYSQGRVQERLEINQAIKKRLEDELRRRGLWTR